MDIGKSSLQLFLARIAGAIFEFFGIVYFAQEIGASKLGIFFLFQACIGILSLPSDFGLRGAVEKRISEGEDTGEYLSAAYLLKTSLSILVCLIIYLFRYRINKYLGTEAADLLIIAILLQAQSRLFISVLRGELRVGETAILELLIQISWVIIGMFFISIGYTDKGLIFGLLTGLLVSFAVGIYRISINPEIPKCKHIKSLIRYGKYNSITHVGGKLYSWMDLAIIGVFLSQSHVGAYESAWRITVVVIFLSRSIGKALFPQVSEWDSAKNRSRIESAIHNTITPSIMFVIPSLFGSAIFSKKILSFLFGEEFEIAWLALVILMAEKIPQSIHAILSRSLLGINRPDLAAYATSVSVVINIGLNIILIYKFGIVGAAIATAISFTLNTILHGYYLSKEISIKIPLRNIRWCFVSSIIMALFLLILKSLYRANNIYSLILFILLGAFIYASVLLANNEFRGDLRTSWSEVT